MKLWGPRAKAPNQLAKLLPEYPVYSAPHSGHPSALTLLQAEENLAYLLANRPARLAHLAQFLGHFGVKIAGYEAGDTHTFTSSLHRWSLREWPGINIPPSIASTDAWLKSNRLGDGIVYSMLMDVALFLAELVLTRKPEYEWALDLDPSNYEMPSYKRPVVLARPASFSAPVVLDFEGVVVGHFFRAHSPAFGVLDDFSTLVSDAVSGAYERC